MSKLNFNHASHEYKLDGVLIPSVTQLLADNGLTNFNGIDQDVLNRAAEFGNAVHKCVDLKCKGILDDSSVDDALKGYIVGWDNFVEDFGFEVTGSEIMGFHPTYRYAYRMDLVGNLTKGKYQGLCVADIKSGLIKPADRIQLAGYQLAAGKDYKIVCIIYLNPNYNRGYKVLISDKNKQEQSVFLSCLSITNWKNKEKIK